MYAVSVVVADDDERYREGLKAMLAPIPPLGVVGEASTGLELLNAVRVHRPDAVIVDVHMPEMDGIRATRELRKRFGPRLLIIVLTGSSDPQTMLRAKAAGADAVLHKHDLLEHLVALLRTIEQETTKEGGPYDPEARRSRIRAAHEGRV